MEAGGAFTLGSQIGRYTLEVIVARGGMGVVYRAYDSDLQRRVAVKVMTPHLTSATALGRFQREAAAVAQLRHPGIAAVFDFGKHDTQPYIVFEWIEGRGLNIVLEEEKRLPLDRALRLAAQLGSALDYAHQRGILHRDLKPSNILLTPDDTPIIIDFGLAWLAGENTLTMPGALFGTPRYMAPEQFHGEKLDARADLYSLAVIVYEMIAGQPPFPGDTIQSLYHQHLYAPPPDITGFSPGVPKPIALTLARALAKDAALRFASGAAFSAALRNTSPPPEAPVTDTMAQTIPVLAVPSSRPPASHGALKVSDTVAVTVPDTAPVRPAAPRSNRGLMAVVAGLMVTFCVVWSLALAMLWPRAAAPAPTRPPAEAIAIVQPTSVALPAEWTATHVSVPATASSTALRAATQFRAATQTPLIVTVVVTNVIVNITATSPPTGSPTSTSSATGTMTTALGQPSNTPPPTPTQTPFPSATHTLVGAATQTNPPTSTAPPTATPTSAPTTTPPPPTATQPSAPTNTPSAPASATASVTVTAAAGCTVTGGALAIAGDELTWPLSNPGATTVTIASIDLNWPDAPAQQRLDAVFVGGTRIANNNDNQPPSALPAEIPWEGRPASLRYPPGASDPLRFRFREPLAATGFSVSVTFDNGCTLNASN